VSAKQRGRISLVVGVMWLWHSSCADHVCCQRIPACYVYGTGNTNQSQLRVSNIGIDHS
jgi:hypothetical protein